MAILPVTVEREAVNLLNNTWTGLNTHRTYGYSFLDRYRFNRYIEIDLTKENCIRTPLYCSELISAYLSEYNRAKREAIRTNRKLPNTIPSKLIIPLEVYPSIQNVRSADMLFRKSIEGRGNTLYKFDTPKDGIFYGLPGIIFDKDFRPLIFLSKLLYLNEEHLEFSRDIKVYIDPSVVKADNMVTRFIYNKLIPYLMLESNVNMKVSIKEIDLYTTPNIKNVEGIEDFSTEIPQMLKDNHEDILNKILRSIQ